MSDRNTISSYPEAPSISDEAKFLFEEGNAYKSVKQSVLANAISSAMGNATQTSAGRMSEVDKKWVDYFAAWSATFQRNFQRLATTIGSVHIATVSDGTVPLGTNAFAAVGLSLGRRFRVVGAQGSLGSGTVTARLQIDGVNITGLDSMLFNSATLVDFNSINDDNRIWGAGQKLDLVLADSGSVPADFRLTIVFQDVDTLYHTA
jgi:hypothetical protein